MSFVDETAHPHAFFHARADRPLAHFGADRLDQIVVHVFVDEQARARPAHLSSVHENTKAYGFGGITEVGIGEDDVGTLSTELERDGCQLFAGFRHHGLPRRHAAGQHHTVHACVACERIARQCARTGQDLKHP